MSREFILVLTGDRNAGTIEVGEFTGGKRQRSHSSNGAGDPTVSFLFLHNLASGIGGRPKLSSDRNFPILVRASLGKLIMDFVEFLQKVEALGFQFLCLHFERLDLLKKLDEIH